MPTHQGYYSASTTAGHVPLGQSAKAGTYPLQPSQSKVPSYTHSVASAGSSYAPSSVGTRGSSRSTGGVDLASLLGQQFDTAFDTTSLDRGLAAQAQT
jgi:hypothetical protein